MSTAALFGPVVTLLCIGILLTLIANLRSTSRLDDYVMTHQDPARLISVLVPARNEGDNIGPCVRALLAQDYPHIEVLVLDDDSDDDTAAIVRSFDDPRLRLFTGETLPEGWTGKNWACHQLASKAQGDVLCFVDADTLLAPSTLSSALAIMNEEEADLVTLLVAAEYNSTTEAVLLPMVNHALLALFPIWLMHGQRFPRLAIGLGPFMMIHTATYEACGGHAAAPGHVVDDVELCRAVKGIGGTVRLANGTSMVGTRWYSSVGDIWRGFSKNAFGALDSSSIVALTTVLVLVPLLCTPFIRVADGLLTGSLATEPVLQALMLLTTRAITSHVGRDPLWSTFAYPITVLFWGATLAWSVILTAANRSVEWRGRPVAVNDPMRR